MEIHPTKEEFLALAGKGNVIPVYADLMADFETPVSAYAKLRAHGPAYLLESVEGGENLSRYSFIGCRPRKVFACGPRVTEIREQGRPAREVPDPHGPALAGRGRDPAVPPGQAARACPASPGAPSATSATSTSRGSSPRCPRRRATSSRCRSSTSCCRTRCSSSTARSRPCACASTPTSRTASAAGAERARSAAEAELRELFEILSQPSALAPAPLAAAPVVEVPAGNFTRAGVREARRERQGVHPGGRHHPGGPLPEVHAPVREDPAGPLPGPAGP